MEQEKTFRELGIDERILRALDDKGLSVPTRVQQEAITPLMDWRDVIAKAPTGTGKTFAFGIPMIQHIDPANDQIQALVLAPTRELALQFLTVLSVATLGSCYEWPVEGGIIAGGGHTKYPAIVDNLFMWLFTIPTAALSAFVFRWPPLVTFCFLKADQILKCIPNAIVCNRYRWVRELTRDEMPD